MFTFFCIAVVWIAGTIIDADGILKQNTIRNGKRIIVAAILIQ